MCRNYNGRRYRSWMAELRRIVCLPAVCRRVGGGSRRVWTEPLPGWSVRRRLAGLGLTSCGAALLWLPLSVVRRCCMTTVVGASSAWGCRVRAIH
jgi:hypothetical protein